MAETMSRRSLLTGAFRKDADPPDEERGRPHPRRDSGVPPTPEQRETLDLVLEQMNGPTGFEDLEVRKS